MGSHNWNPKRPRTGQWSCAPLVKRAHAHPVRWASGAAAGIGVLAATFWGTPPMAPGQALQLASPDAETGSTRVPELLPGSRTSLNLSPVRDLGVVLEAGVMSTPELLKVALIEPLRRDVPATTIGVHSAGHHEGPRPSPVVRPPCPDPVHNPAGYRAWWARWFPSHPLPAPSAPAETPPVTEGTAPEPTSTPEPEPTHAPEPEPTHVVDQVGDVPEPVVDQVGDVLDAVVPEHEDEPEPAREESSSDSDDSTAEVSSDDSDDSSGQNDDDNSDSEQPDNEDNDS